MIRFLAIWMRSQRQELYPLLGFISYISQIQQYSIVQYSTVHYSIVQQSRVQYSTVQYSTVRTHLLLSKEPPHHTTLADFQVSPACQGYSLTYSMVWYIIVWNSVVQYSTVQYSTVPLFPVHQLFLDLDERSLLPAHTYSCRCCCPYFDNLTPHYTQCLLEYLDLVID